MAIRSIALLLAFSSLSLHCSDTRRKFGETTPSDGGAGAAGSGGSGNQSTGGAGNQSTGGAGNQSTGGAAGQRDPALSLSLGTSELAIVFDRTASLTVEVQRGGGFAGDVPVTVSELPAGVTAESLTIGAAETTGSLTLTASGLSSPGDEATGVRVTASDGGALTSTQTMTVRVVGQPGQPDATFRANGVLNVTLAGDPTYEAGAVLTDGQLMIAGHQPDNGIGQPYAHVSKYFANGTSVAAYRVAESFPDPPHRDATFEHFSILPDGRAFFVVESLDISGSPIYRTYYYVFDAAGQPQATFGTNGVAQVTSRTGGPAVHGAWVDPSTSEPVFSVAGGPLAPNFVNRRLADATQHPDWTGAIMNPAHAGTLFTRDDNGNLVVAAASGAVYRFLPSGNQDQSWGTAVPESSTAKTYYFSNVSLGGQAAIFTDLASVGGKTYLLGYSASGSFMRVAVLNATGDADPSFGSNGETASLNPDGGVNITSSKLLTYDGHLYVSGANVSSSGPQLIVARYDLAGQLDTGFGDAGAVRQSGFGTTGSSVRVFGLGIQNGKLIVFAQRASNADKALLIYRYWL